MERRQASSPRSCAGQRCNCRGFRSTALTASHRGRCCYVLYAFARRRGLRLRLRAGRLVAAAAGRVRRPVRAHRPLEEPVARAAHRLGVRPRPVRGRPQLDRDRLHLSGGMPAWLGWVAVVLLSLYLAVYPALATGLAWRFGTRRPGRARHRSSAAPGRSPNGCAARCSPAFPWNPAAAALAPTPLITITPLDRHLRPVRAWWSCSAARSGSNIYKKWLPLVVILGVTLLLWLLPSSPRPGGPADDRTVRIVQPNIGQEDKWRPGFDEEAARRLASSVRPAERRAAAAAVARGRDHRPARGRAHRRASGHGRIPAHARRGAARPDDRLLTGGIADRLARRRPRRWRRQQHLRARAGRARSSAATTRRISCPTANICRCGRCCRRSACRGSRRATSISRRARARARSTSAASGARSASSSATKSSSRARWSTSTTAPTSSSIPSNDAWFGRWGPPQHLAQARLRAAEEGMPVLRSTPTGISAVIDGRGNVVKALPWRTAGVIDAVLPPPRFAAALRALRQCHPAAARASR